MTKLPNWVIRLSKQVHFTPHNSTFDNSHLRTLAPPNSAMLDAILNLLFPVTCILCNSQVLERRWGPVCPICWGKLSLLQRPFCEQCGMPAPAIEGLCSSCRL